MNKVPPAVLPEPPALKPARRAARRGYSVRYKDKTLLSTVDPVTQAERIAAEAGGAERTLYFCPSPLLGYGLDTLLASLDVNSAILGVETDPELLALSRSSIDETILKHPRFALSDSGDGAELCRLVRKTWGSRVFRRLKVVKLSGGWQLDSGTYEATAELLRWNIAVDWGNAMTLVKLGRRYIRNALHNLPLLDRFPTITELSFGSKPVLVLGAGPSLDPFLDALKITGALDASERPFAIVCADTCLSLLRERGISPDLAVILESQFWNMGDFIGSRDAGIPAAVDLSAYPASRAVLNGPVFFFFTPWTNLKLFERMQAVKLLPPALPPLGSVGLTAVELARRLSTGPIITAGIDFSFALDKTHARSSPAHLSSLTTHTRLKSLFNVEAAFRSGTFSALSKSQIPVKSDPALRSYRCLFEQEFAADPRIMDIDGTGLPLGVKTLSIEEAAALLTRPRVPCQETTAEPVHNPVRTVNAEPQTKPSSAELAAFIESERALLLELRNILTGSAPASTERLETLLDEADYLWAHFPDCAGTEGRRPSASDTAFLKRVRAELDPFIALWKLSIPFQGIYRN